MTNKKEYIGFDYEYESALNLEKGSRYVVIRGRQVLMNVKDGQISMPTKEACHTLQLDEAHSIHLGNLGDTAYVAVRYIDGESINESLQWLTFEDDRWPEVEELYFIAVKAGQVLAWDQASQFCGACGTKNERKADERAKICPKCGLVQYPKISPAIIVGVKKEDKVLLAHNKNFKEGLYGVVAGFVEQGETLEHAIKREVYEETKIKVKNIRYLESKPWHNSDSLMLGFIAEYESGEIEVDGIEITDAGWFDKDHLPPHLPMKITIARTIIDHLLGLDEKSIGR